MQVARGQQGVVRLRYEQWRVGMCTKNLNNDKKIIDNLLKKNKDGASIPLEAQTLLIFILSIRYMLFSFQR